MVGYQCPSIRCRHIVLAVWVYDDMSIRIVRIDAVQVAGLVGIHVADINASMDEYSYCPCCTLIHEIQSDNIAHAWIIPSLRSIRSKMSNALMPPTKCPKFLSD